MSHPEDHKTTRTFITFCALLVAVFAFTCFGTERRICMTVMQEKSVPACLEAIQRTQCPEVKP